MIRFFCYILGFHPGIPDLLNDFLKFSYISFQYFVGFLCCKVLSFSSVAQSRPALCNPMDCSTAGFPVHHQLPELAHPTISSSVVPFSSHLQSFPASGSFPMSQFFASGGQSIEASISASVLPMYIQD